MKKLHILLALLLLCHMSLTAQNEFWSLPPGQFDVQPGDYQPLPPPFQILI